MKTNKTDLQIANGCIKDSNNWPLGTGMHAAYIQDAQAHALASIAESLAKIEMHMTLLSGAQIVFAPVQEEVSDNGR